MTTLQHTVGTILDHYLVELQGRYDQREAQAIARSIFSHHLGWDAAQVATRRTEALSIGDQERVMAPLSRLRAGEPLQYILGLSWFLGLELVVGPGVLIPRPETEELVDHIIRAACEPRRIVDVGTGSGCIAIGLQRAFPNAEVHGLDVSPDALRIARANGELHAPAVSWVRSNVLDPGSEFPLCCDLIVSNPPYIPRTEAASLHENVREHEPHLALFVEDEDPLLFYRAIADRARTALLPDGELWFECHHQHGKAVHDLLVSMEFSDVQLLKDINSVPRFIRARR